MQNLSQGRNHRQDRIERGVCLSTSGHVISSRPGQWIVRSESDQATTYSVTAEACDCRDSKKGQSICKHQWASAGFVAAFVILALRKATTIDLASRILTPAYQMLASLPSGYLRTIEDEFTRAVERIGAGSRNAEASTATKSDATRPALLLTRDCSHAECLTTRC